MTYDLTVADTDPTVPRQVADQLTTTHQYDPATVGAAITLWATTQTRPGPRVTDLVRDKRVIVTSFFDFVAKHPVAVQPLDVQAWKLALEARQLKPATIYSYLAKGSSFFSWLRKDPRMAQQITSNPFTLIRPKAPEAYQSTGTKALMPDEVQRLLNYVKQMADAGSLPAIRDYALLLLFFTTGWRRREVIQLAAGDVRLNVRGAPLALTTEQKGGKTRTRLVRSTAVFGALTRYLAATGRTLNALDPADPLWLAHDNVRTTRSNGDPERVVRTRHDPLKSHGFAKNLKAYGKEVGIANLHVHHTHHSFAAKVANVAASCTTCRRRSTTRTRVYVDRIRVQEDRFGATLDEVYGLNEREE